MNPHQRFDCRLLSHTSLLPQTYHRHHLCPTNTLFTGHGGRHSRYETISGTIQAVHGHGNGNGLLSRGAAIRAAFVTESGCVSFSSRCAATQSLNVVGGLFCSSSNLPPPRFANPSSLIRCETHWHMTVAYRRCER